MKQFAYVFLFLLLAGCKSDPKEGVTEISAVSNADHSPELQESIKRGKKIYNNFCASCHLTNGDGITGVFPPVNQADWLTEKRKETILAVKHGLRGPITVNGVKYDNFMPSLGLDDREVADVLNYIFNAWDNNIEEPVTVEEVEAITK